MHRKQRRSAVLATLSVFTLHRRRLVRRRRRRRRRRDRRHRRGVGRPRPVRPTPRRPAETEAPADTDAPDDTTATDETEAPDDTEPADDDGDAPSVTDRELPPGERHVERTRASRCRAATSCSASRPTPPTRGRRTGRAARRPATSSSRRSPTRCSRRPTTARSRRCSSSRTSPTPTTPSGRSTIRDGITFHDGTPLDGAAVEFNIESCQYSPLTGAAFLSIEDIASSGQDGHHHDEGAVRRAAPPVHRAAVRVTCSRRRG